MTDYNVAAGMYGMLPNAYSNQIALNDLSGMDLYSPTGSMGMMGMNGSLFSGMGTGMMPMMGGMYGGNYEQYYKNYENYQDFMVGNQVRQQERLRSADIKIKSVKEGVELQANVLREKIMRGDQRNISEAYNSYVESVATMYGTDSKEAAINKAMNLYEQQYKSSITNDIRQYGKCSFREGLESGVTFSLLNDITAEDNISAITGQQQDNWEKVNKWTGKASGWGILSLAGVTAFKHKSTLWDGMKRCKMPLIAGITLGVGLLATGLTSAKET